MALQIKKELDTKCKNISPETIADIQQSVCSVITGDLVNNIKVSPVFAIMWKNQHIPLSR